MNAIPVSRSRLGACLARGPLSSFTIGIENLRYGSGLPRCRTLAEFLTGSAACLWFLCWGLLPASAGTWWDDFSAKTLSPQWVGDRDHFLIQNGVVDGFSASPLAPVPLRLVEVGTNWDNYVVQCGINVVTPNLLVCTKGALILRHNGNEGYVFALHQATQTVEVYRLSDHEMLLSKAATLELKHWYRVRAELQGDQLSFFLDGQLVGTLTDERSPAGAVGLAVQDALSVLFNSFSVSGPQIPDSSLRISISQGRINLVWPPPPVPVVLQWTDSLTAPVNWATLTNISGASGGPGTLQLDMAPGQRFFRLAVQTGLLR